jgi:membrane protease YdiL (CAAX protease family)
VDDTPVSPPVPDSPAAPQPAAGPAPPVARWAALFEVIAVCGIPTQLMVGLFLIRGLGMAFDPAGGLSLQFFASLSLADTALVAILIRLFLWFSDERPADVFLGTRPVRGEILRGLALVPIVFVLVTGLVVALRAVVPSLHTVAENPLEGFLDNALSAGVFLFVAVLAGGVREELQRAFILHRFAQRLGGIKVGLVVFSLLFGLLHVDQGADVAIAIGLLGFAWGVLFIVRRSAILGMANHAGFNALQVVQGLVVRSLGG